MRQFLHDVDDVAWPLPVKDENCDDKDDKHHVKKELDRVYVLTDNHQVLL